MKHLSTAFLLLLLSTTLTFAQKSDEEDAIKSTINLLFDGMRNSDTTMIRKAFASKNTMQTIARTKDGKSVVKTESVDNFIKSIATPHSEKYDERIVFTKILVDANLASVWTDYKFYVGDKFSHCGVNSFQLFKDEEGWKIIYIIDTRRKDNCN
ncbi:MAG: hypothetical protein EOO47_05135 [Flavobacterium sp.]|nr:MAG: hypothetical protein EOO47_05135 [Flavobacterium sp.]